MIVALLVILLWFGKGYRQVRAQEERTTLPVMVLAFWVIASAVFGPLFFALRPAGLFDISIERLLFLMILFFLMIGLFQGKVRFDRNIAIELIMLIFVPICLVSMIRTGFLPASPDFPSPWYVFISSPSGKANVNEGSRCS